MGGALLETLEAVLAPQGLWTPQAAAAWAAVYGVVADTMKEGAKEDPEHERCEREYAIAQRTLRTAAPLALPAASRGAAWPAAAPVSPTTASWLTVGVAVAVGALAFTAFSYSRGGRGGVRARA